MLPISTKDLFRFTPPDCEGEAAPVYLIEVPSILTRPLHDRTLAERGIYLPKDADLRRALEDGIRDVVEDHQQAELLAVSAAYWDAAEADPKNIPADVEGPYRAMVDQLLPELPQVRKLNAARAYFFQMLPVVACECFLKGVENVDVEFKLAGGLVSPKTLRALDPNHVLLAGWQAVKLMALSGDQEKNSASPSRSPSAPGTSTAEPSPKTGDPDGTSSANSTPRTPASD